MKPRNSTAVSYAEQRILMEHFLIMSSICCVLPEFYCRTVISSNRFDIPRDWLRLQATCHHNDPKLNELANRFISATRVGEPLLFYLWGHSYEFEADNNWELIEDLLAKIGGRDDTYYATNIEIYDYVHAFRELIFSADGKRVYNPMY